MHVPDDIRLLICDVDGVLTDGRIVVHDAGGESKNFSVKDGTGLKYWLRAGNIAAIISGRTCPATELRARQLGIEHVIQGAKVKIDPYRALLRELKIADRQTAYIGDDLPDIVPMRRCGFPVAVADAPREVKRYACMITSAAGGDAAVREVVELLLRASGKWRDIVARYLADDV